MIERPTSVVEAALGVVAGALGLWLMWSAGEPVATAVDRSQGQPANITAKAPDDPRGANLDVASPALVPDAGSIAADLDAAAGSDAFGSLAGPAEALQAAEPARVPSETGPAERQARSAEPLIARLRDLRVSRMPAPQRQTARERREASPREAPARLNRAGLRGETVVGWLSLPDDLPAARPGDEALLAALPVIKPEREPATVPAWVRHAAVAPRPHDRPTIAVVIDDLGMNRHNTALVNQLPGPLTLAFLPYAGALEQQTRAARAAGHELLVHMPMEPLGQDWPGPDALLASLGPEQFAARLRANLDRFSGFVGLNNHMGSLLTADREHMGLVIAELRRRDLLFLDSKTTARSIASDEAKRQGVPFVERDVFLDNRIDPQHIVRQLERTEEIARERGMAVAIGHPHDLTLEALRRWLPTLEERGFALVPISTVVAQQSCAGEASMSGCGRLHMEPSIGALAAEAANRQS